MSQHRAADHRPPESQLWRPEPTSARGTQRQSPDKQAAKKPLSASKPRVDSRSTGSHRLDKHGLDKHGLDKHGLDKHSPDRHRVGVNAPPLRANGGPLTAFGVSIVLTGACLIGASLDLLLVSTAAWGLTGLFLAACAYAAAKVRRSDWYSAVVGPPLAFACGLLLVAAFSPHDISSGLTGTLATILELLAFKARAVFFGTGLALCVTLARKLPFARQS
jgi:hypothetical protein